ncbi:MAG TPA: hypothetical protein VM240_07085 [Verrucomicrobiae bacterium]|nr:hypothetical protein [Verrucomicrobiae bacterium]
MPSHRLTVAMLAALLSSGPALAQDDYDAQPVTRLTLQLVLPTNRGQIPGVSLLLGSRDHAVAMPLAGPVASHSLNQFEEPDALYPTDMGKWIWWGLGGVALAAVLISQSGSDADPAPSGTGAGP